MPPIEGWFKARKSLHNRRPLPYYEDVYGEKNPEEELEGVHVLDSESDSESEILRPRAKRQVRDKIEIAHRKDNTHNEKQAMESIDDNGIAAPTVSEVITIDDDSDVEDVFVADLRKYAAQNNGEQTVQRPNDHDEIDPEFLAEVKRYASKRPGTGNKQHEETLDEIEQRAQQFADQSPLKPKEPCEPDSNEPEHDQPEHDEPEPSKHTVVLMAERSDEAINKRSSQLVDKTSEMVSDSTNARPFDSKIVSDSTTRRSVEAFPRAHSWDSSQGSEYAYSEGRTPDHPISAESHQKGIDENIDEATKLFSADTEDRDDDDIVFVKDKTQREEYQDEERNTSGVQNDDHGVIELEESETSNEADDHLARLVTRNQDSANIHNNDDGFSSEPAEVFDHKKRRRFGLFAVSSDLDTESITDSLYTKPPQRLEELVKKRRVEREKREAPEKKTKYNLRPRRESTRNYEEESTISDSKIAPEAVEPPRSLRITRSMKTREQIKRPIPRHKAARRTAWAARITPKDRLHGREFNRQIVQVVIPAVGSSSKTGHRDARPEAPNGQRQVLDVVLID